MSAELELDPYLNPKEKDTSLETEPTLWRRLCLEGLGTFALAFNAELANALPFGHFVAGGYLVCILFLGLQVSGSHMNPAITLCILCRYGMPLFQVLCMVAVQCLCAIFGAVIAYGVIKSRGDNVTPLGPHDYAPINPSLLMVNDATGFPLTILLEIVLTFGFCCIALTCASAIKNRVSSTQMLVLMSYTVLCVAVMGPVSGSVLNPAVGLAQNIVGSFKWEEEGARDLWVFVMSTCVGGMLAGLTFRAIHAIKNREKRHIHPSFVVNSNV